ncbi:MAG: dihydrolipoyl dehydrogenase [Bdellovibrionales bacterium]|nr:dihydrolipoyl dehydrogenase [Bdellovibrionales bacterium]
METKKFDAVVIGAGPGGYVCAIRLAQLGKKTAVIERDSVGGVCLNVGCIPSKALIKASTMFEKMQKASDMGFQVKGVDVNFGALQEWKHGVVTKLTAGVGQLLKGNKVEVIKGDAKFTGPKQLEVTSGPAKLAVQADHIVIAVGSSPIEIPGFKFDEKKILSSTGALAIDRPVKSAVVVGAGYIGLELGTYLAKFGTQVTLIEQAERLLPGYDPDVSQVITRGLKRRNVNILTKASAKGVREKGSLMVVDVEVDGKPQQIEAEKVLVTVGRRPNPMPGLDKAGVKVDAKGFIPVNGRLQTNVPGIYAIGDVAGQPMLAHKASKEALVVAEVIAGKKGAKYDVKAMPAVIFCEPEVSCVGLSETEAKAKGIVPMVGSFPFGALGKAIASGETDGFAKLIGDKKTGRLVGAVIVGAESSSMIAEMALAIEAGLQLEDVALTVHAHPTMGEATMEAAEVALGHAVHILQKS